MLPLVVLLAVNRSQLPVFVFQHVIVLLVAARAIGWGVRVALVSAIVAVAADNVLLQDPIVRPAITGVCDAVDLALFVVVAVIVGWLVASEEFSGSARNGRPNENCARAGRDGLIATIAHDLATSLNVIRGGLQLAERPLGAVLGGRLDLRRAVVMTVLEPCRALEIREMSARREARRSGR